MAWVCTHRVAFATWFGSNISKSGFLFIVSHSQVTFITLLPSRVQHCAKQYPICISVFMCTQQSPYALWQSFHMCKSTLKILPNFPFLTIPKSHWIDFKNVFYISPFLDLSPIVISSQKGMPLQYTFPPQIHHFWVCEIFNFFTSVTRL